MFPAEMLILLTIFVYDFCNKKEKKYYRVGDTSIWKEG